MEGTQKQNRLIFALALLGLFGLNLALYGPLFSPQQRPYRGSIAAGYAGITRFISEHPNPFAWNPQQYAGLPTQFTYPPLLPYTASSLHWLTGIEPYWAYRITTATFACLGPVTLALAFYWLMRSRKWAILLGLAASLLSPLYGLFEALDTDRGIYYLPWRLLVLMKYGEGPHLVGLTLLPLTLAAIVWAGRRKDFASLFLMAIAFALTPLLNWLSAFALTICVLVLWLSDHKLILRTVLAALWGYLLACFWLTPSYVFTTLFNWPKDSYGYQVEQSHWPLYLGFLILLALARWAMSRLAVPWRLQYLTLLTLAFCWIVSGFYLANRDTIPESRRYSLELEMFLMSSIAAWLCTAFRSREVIDRLSASLAILALFAGGLGQMQQSIQRSWADWGIVDREQSAEFKIAQWLVAQKPQGRIFSTGGLRFRLNAWTPLHQVAGTFESGLRNRIAVDRFYQIRTGEQSKPDEEGLDAMRQLSTLGVEYAIFHGLESEDYYKDVKNPNKLKGLAPVVFEATPHDWVHRLPYSGLAHLVSASELPKDKYKEALPALAAAVADPQRPKLLWREENPSLYRISGPVRPGDEIFVAMNHDPGWVATQDGAPIPLAANNMGMLRLFPKPKASTEILLAYQATTEQKAFAALSALAWIASMTLWLRRR